MNFKNTDIIVVNSPNIDFPLFRKFLIENHHYFNKIHYVFYYNSITWENKFKYQYNYSELAESTMPFANFYWADEKNKDESLINDTRNMATNLGLNNIDKNVEGVLFLEPDIIVNNINYLLELPHTFDFVGYCEISSYRLSPSFLWVKKNIIDMTSRNFTATPSPVFSDIRKLTLPAWSTVPIKDRITTFVTPCGADSFDKFTSELLGITTNAHLFHNYSFDFEHLGAIIQTIQHFRDGRYKIYDLVKIKNYFIKTLEECDHILNKEYIQEVNIHLQNINQIFNN